MTFPAAFLGTTVRVLRTAGGRRALQLALLVGGLFALGFLCGEQAHAADGTPPRETVTAVRESVTSTGSGAVVPGDPVRVLRSGGERVVTSVREVASAVSRTAEGVYRTAGNVSRTVGKARPRATPPSLPLPVEPAPSTPQAQVPAPGPRQGSGGTAARAATPAAAPAAAPAAVRQRLARNGTRTPGRAEPAPLASYGPQLTPAPQRPAQTSAHPGTATVVGAPGRPAPTGDPDGVLGKQAGDGTTSRHSDACAYAVTPGDRAPLWFAPRAAARGDAPRTRERHADIPVFPG
ncbi:hypothetical protein [Streptomyces sp. MMG1121]|uniref:hypothetical protein n=1 Tax=Streptomyces sp. MMG1121 TaxID=1415544 RepID=UPI0006AEF7C8|nr:hypothetical protein [Streptomyces sp. MMG1121]KOV67188.1 hypothetical protein ADK64_10100 [Streptomyces sp. MMG1121]